MVSEQSLDSLFRGSKNTIEANVAHTIAAMLANIVASNSDVIEKDDETPFGVAWTYEWADIGEYIDRLQEWISCGPESFVVAVCLLKRLEAQDCLPALVQKNIHRIFFCILVLAVKMTEDETLRNPDFAKVGCVAAPQLSHMELYLLKALNFACCVSPSEFTQCCAELNAMESCIKKGNMKPFSRTGEVPLTVSAVMKEIQIAPPMPPVRKLSMFTLRRKTSGFPSHATPATPKSTEANTSKVSPVSSAPVSSAPVPVKRTSSISALMTKKTGKPSLFASNQRKSTEDTPQTHSKSFLGLPSRNRAAPRVLLRQDSI